jgi:hypothetical protein
MRLRFVSLLLFIVALCAMAGCAKPRLDRVVSAETARDFAAWQRDNRDAFTADEWAEFETVLQDLKVRIIALREATGGDAVNDALRPKLHGRTVRDVLKQGYEARLWRLNVERTEFEKMIAGNATLGTRSGDVASQNYLAQKAREQQGRLDRTKAAIREAEEKLKALGAPPPK